MNDSNQTLEFAIDQFLEWGSAHYSNRTIITYSSLLDKCKKHFGPEKSLAEIRPVHISQYIFTLKKAGYAESSIAYMLTAIRVLFKFLQLHGQTTWDYRLVQIPKYTSKHFPTVRKDVVDELAGNIRIDDLKGLRDKAIVLFLYATGVRVSELCDLTIEEIDEDTMRGTIVTKKSRKQRMILWDYETNETLKQYLAEREQWATTDHVFISLTKHPDYFGGKLTTRSVQRIIAKHRPKGRRIVPHSFRSGLATDMLENRVSLRVIQESLGHQSMASLEPYARVHNVELEREYRRVRG